MIENAGRSLELCRMASRRQLDLFVLHQRSAARRCVERHRSRPTLIGPGWQAGSPFSAPPLSVSGPEPVSHETKTLQTAAEIKSRWQNNIDTVPFSTSYSSRLLIFISSPVPSIYAEHSSLPPGSSG